MDKSMEEKTFVGYMYGRFKNDQGEMQSYCNAFMLEDFAGSVSNDYCYDGQKAVKYPCVSPAVFQNVPVGAKVQCYFDSKKKISYMVQIDG